MTIEPLESRRLLDAVQVNAAFTGTEEHVIDGREVSETITVTATPGKGSTTNVALTIQDNLKTLSTLLTEKFTGNSAKKHPTLSADIPSSIGSGTIQIAAGETMSISATLATGIFAPLAFTFAGAATANASAGMVSAPSSPAAPSPTGGTVTSPAQTNPNPIVTNPPKHGGKRVAKSAVNFAEALSIAPFATAAANPAIGFYIGHLAPESDGASYVTKTTIRTNKLGHSAIDMLIADPGFGSIEIASTIHPTHTGAFTLNLGSQAVDGILTGHITHTGRLVLELNVAGFSNLTGSQKRH